ISDSPSGSSNNGESDGGSSFGTGGTNSGSAGSGGGSPTAPGAAGSKGDEGTDDPKKTIEEADIVQVRGSRLYALSRYSGLAIIDVADADHLKTLGRYPLSGTPFEMYVRDNTVLAMFSDWGRYECTGSGATESCQWVTSSHIVALDAADPANLQARGTFDLPGEISDSRIVGDVLYAVTYESGYCWNCSDKPNTTISSLALKDLASIKRVDKVTYENVNSDGGWWRRSISVNDKRMYVAGVEWSSTGNWQDGHSTIQVIDISDPAGKLAVGATVQAHGQIESRWQMDEHEGTLRVISQPGQWSMEEAPQIQTFAVKSAFDVTPIAAKDLVLPKPERLRSVRFDGTRAFAITAEQQDPLFTFDLSDPADPKQLGELEMPGWVYHMEPRGDRMLALGFDNGNQAGSLHVSLFDIADLSKPTLMKRVNFGGDWGNFAEDQDRIHKAFTILDDQDLVLVPFAGWSSAKGPNGETWGCGSYESGIQLVDWKDDTLTKRGVAPQKGQARRALLKDDRLLALSDDKLSSFDISNRDAPVLRSDRGLSHKVSRTLPVGSQLVRLSADWWTGEALLDVVPLAEAESTESAGRLDLSSVTGKDTGGCYGSSIYNAQILANGTTLTLVWGDYSYGYYDGYYGGGSPRTHVVTISIADPQAPQLVGHTELPFALGYYGYYGYGYGYGDGVYSVSSLSAGKSVVQLGSTLAIQRSDYTSSDGATSFVEVVDLSDPTKPTHTGTLPLAGNLYQTGLQLSGNQVITSHAEPVANQPDKVRFYLDRLDLSDPAAPKVASQVNVPGSPLRLDASGRLVSVDYKHTVTKASSWDECHGQGYYYGGGKWFDSTSQECVSQQKILRLSSIGEDGATLLDSHALDQDGMWVDSVTFGSDRLFGLGSSYDAQTGQSSQRLFALGGLDSDHFSPEALTLPATTSSWYYGNYSLLGVTDNRAVLMSYSNESQLSTVDLSAPAGQQVVEHGALLSWAYDVQLVGSSAIVALQERGVQVVSLAK
ncbi:MAG: hypothetical protein EOO75_03385, partial [Myxococcales bacterium]